MTLNEYIKSLIRFSRENPGSGDKEICYASDDEGNDFHMAVAEPSFMSFDGIDFMFVDDIKESSHVCIN